MLLSGRDGAVQRQPEQNYLSLAVSRARSQRSARARGCGRERRVSLWDRSTRRSWRARTLRRLLWHGGLSDWRGASERASDAAAGRSRLAPSPLIGANLVSPPSPDRSPGVVAAGASVSRRAGALNGWVPVVVWVTSEARVGDERHSGVRRGRLISTEGRLRCPLAPNKI